MKVLLVRHAEAADVGRDGVRSDGERPLTEAGHATAARLASALHSKGYSFDALLCSPLLRARQTAEPLKRLLAGSAPFAICPELAPESDAPDVVCCAIVSLKVKGVVVVGHLPDIAGLARYLCGGHVEFDKGTAASFDCGGDLSEGASTLEWLLSPEWY